MHIYLIRHAQSTANEKRIISGGRSNVGLSETGKQQAQALAQRLKTLEDPAAIYSSPAQQARETARIALREAKIPQSPRIDERLIERSEGEFEGRPYRDLLKASGAISRLYHFAINGKNFSLPGGESINDVGARMAEWLEEIRKLKRNNSVVFVFTHGMAITCLFSEIFEWSKKAVLTTRIPNVSISKITYKDNNWHLNSLQD